MDSQTIKYRSEGDFQESLTRYLKRVKEPYCKFHDEFTSGIPDLIIRGVGFVELKMYGNKHEVSFAQTQFAKHFGALLLFPDGVCYDLAKVADGKPNLTWVKKNSRFKVVTPDILQRYFK